MRFGGWGQRNEQVQLGTKRGQERHGRETYGRSLRKSNVAERDCVRFREHKLDDITSGWVGKVVRWYWMRRDEMHDMRWYEMI